MESEQLSQEEKEDAEYLQALDDLNLTKSEVSKKSSITVQKDKNLSDKVTKINDLAVGYRMALEGKTYIEEDTAYKQTGKAIAGRKFIDLSTSILNSYTNESNLITTKTMEKFTIQFIDAFEKINNFILRDRTISEKDHRLIIKMFKDKLTNTGDIITGTEGNMRQVFQKHDDDLAMKEAELLKSGI